MKKKICIFLILLLTSSLFSSKVFLPEDYCVTYGKKEAPIKIIEYFSYLCPQCVRIFKEDFEILKKDYIDEGLVYWIFHPDPSDLITIQGMICCSYLSERRKQIFLEKIFPELLGIGRSIATEFMKKGLEVLADLDMKTISKLNEESFIKETKAFKEAYQFLVQERFIHGVPTIEINGQLYDDFPTRKFIIKKIEEIRGKK